LLLSSFSRCSTSRRAVFLPMPGSLANSPTACSSKDEENCILQRYVVSCWDSYLEVGIPVVVPVGLDIHFLPDGDDLFRLFFFFAEELARVPDTVEVGVKKNAKLVFAGRKEDLPDDAAVIKRDRILDLVALDKKQPRMPAHVEIHHPDLHLSIVDILFR